MNYINLRQSLSDIFFQWRSVTHANQYFHMSYLYVYKPSLHYFYVFLSIVANSMIASQTYVLQHILTFVQFASCDIRPMFLDIFFRDEVSPARHFKLDTVIRSSCLDQNK